MTRTCGAALGAAVVLTLGIAPGYGGDQGAFKSFLPEDACKQLVQREAKIIQQNLKSRDEDKLKRARVGAVMITGYAISHAKKSAASDALAVVAQDLLKAMGANKLDDAASLTAELDSPGPQRGKAQKLDLRGGLDIDDLMNPLKTVGKGGDGIASELQVNIRLKGALNGVEEKIRNLAVKKLSEPVLDKASKELTLLGYRLAVLAELTHDFPPPKKGKGTLKEWQELSVKMRDVSLDLAQAAQKKDAEALHRASTLLNSSCTQCHSSFRQP